MTYSYKIDRIIDNVSVDIKIPYLLPASPYTTRMYSAVHSTQSIVLVDKVRRYLTYLTLLYLPTSPSGSQVLRTYGVCM